MLKFNAGVQLQFYSAPPPCCGFTLCVARGIHPHLARPIFMYTQSQPGHRQTVRYVYVMCTSASDAHRALSSTTRLASHSGHPGSPSHRGAGHTRAGRATGHADQSLVCLLRRGHTAATFLSNRPNLGWPGPTYMNSGGTPAATSGRVAGRVASNASRAVPHCVIAVLVRGGGVGARVRLLRMAHRLARSRVHSGLVILSSRRPLSPLRCH